MHNFRSCDSQEILPGLHYVRSELNGPQHPVNSYWLQTSQGTIIIDPAAGATPRDGSTPP